MITEKMYEQDAYAVRFCATVISCTPTDHGYAAELDRTCFFPEGGGQPADRGKIGGIPVADVQITDGCITHLLPEPLSVGRQVEGLIDWSVRFPRMQNHSGEHLVSGLIDKFYGYRNVGFHMDDDLVTFDVDGTLQAADVSEIEEAANDAVYRHRPIRCYYPEEAELSSLSYRSKLQLAHHVRIVEIEGYDRCACCAPHVDNTGAIGMIKILRFSPHRGGTRLEMVCGERARGDYHRVLNAHAEAAHLLSAKRDEVVSALCDYRKAAEDIRYENRRLKEKLLFLSLSYYRTERVCLALSENTDGSFDELLYCMNRISEKETAPLLLVLAPSEKGLSYVCGTNRTNGDVRLFVSALNRAFSGRGGGKPDLAQGTIILPRPEELYHFVDSYGKNLH